MASAYFHVSRAIRIQFSELYEITNYLIFSLRFVVLFLGFFLKIAQLFSGSLCTLSQIVWHFDDSRDFFSRSFQIFRFKSETCNSNNAEVVNLLATVLGIAQSTVNCFNLCRLHCVSSHEILT